MSETTTVTCDGCGKTEDARGIVGWLRIENHPAALDVTPLNRAPFYSADVCSWTCLATYGSERTP